VVSPNCFTNRAFVFLPAKWDMADNIFVKDSEEACSRGSLSEGGADLVK